MHTIQPQRENPYLLTCTANEDSDQTAHSRSLIWVFAGRMKKLCLIGYRKSAQWRFWSDCENTQCDLNLRWLYMVEGTFSNVRCNGMCLFIIFFIYIYSYNILIKRTTKPTIRPEWITKTPDQPVHPHSTARVLVHPCLDSPEAVEGTCDQWRLWSDCADAQSDLSLRWSYKFYCRFCRALAH